MADYYQTGFERDVLIALGEIRDTLKEALEIQKKAWKYLGTAAVDNTVHVDEAYLSDLHTWLRNQQAPEGGAR